MPVGHMRDTSNRWHERARERDKTRQDNRPAPVPLENSSASVRFLGLNRRDSGRLKYPRPYYRRPSE